MVGMYARYSESGCARNGLRWQTHLHKHLGWKQCLRMEPRDLVCNTWANSYDNAVSMKIGGSCRMERSCLLAVVTNERYTCLLAVLQLCSQGRTTVCVKTKTSWELTQPVSTCLPNRNELINHHSRWQCHKTENSTFFRTLGLHYKQRRRVISPSCIVLKHVNFFKFN